jgi:ABC-type bacteriocin/lantibiotic exporter with double-glycine peptidase domain
MRLIPYFPQENEHTCGPAVVQMTLASFGIQVEQTTLDEKLETPREADKGTDTKMMIQVLKEYGLAVIEKQPANLSDVQDALTQNAVVIICYTEPDLDFGHYAILSEVADDYVVLVDPDPDHGPNFKMPREEFEKRWRDPLFTKTDHWLVAVSAEQSA